MSDRRWEQIPGTRFFSRNGEGQYERLTDTLYLRVDEVDETEAAEVARRFTEALEAAEPARQADGSPIPSPSQSTVQNAVLIHNERTKLLANAVDRASTAFLTAGIATPFAGRLYNATVPRPVWYYIAAMYVFCSIAFWLHLGARRVLRGLR